MIAFAETCPQCGAPWKTDRALRGTPAFDFVSCAFRCQACGIGFSNARSPRSRTRITREPSLNVPPQARDGLENALAGAVNIHNRLAKHQKFCSARSADAVTWTVAAGLRQSNRLGALAGDATLGAPQALLLWGHPLDGLTAREVHDQLIAISDTLGEHPRRRSEADLVALWPNLLVFAEGKYGSSNNSQPGYRGYDTYLPAPGRFAVDDDAVRDEGSYQLARNWVIGTNLAQHLHVPFVLLNLGPAAIADHAARFSQLLTQSPARRFAHRTWKQVLEEAHSPKWLSQFAEDRVLT